MSSLLECINIKLKNETLENYKGLEHIIDLEINKLIHSKFNMLAE